MKVTRKNLVIGASVKILEDTRCRYYDYPRGQNIHVASAGSVGVVWSCYTPKPCHMYGSPYFVNIKIDGIDYAVDHDKIEVVKV